VPRLGWSPVAGLVQAWPAESPRVKCGTQSRVVRPLANQALSAQAPDLRAKLANFLTLALRNLI